MDERRRRSMAVGAVAVLGLAAVAAVWAAGPMRWGAARWKETLQPAPPVPPVPVPSVSVPPPSPIAPPPGVQNLLQAVLIVVAVVVLLLLLIVLLRGIRIRRRVRGDDGGETVEIAVAPVPLQDEPLAAPVVRGIARALQILEEDRRADDAIVQAWLGLEDAAVASGAGRRPAETPGEYAARIVGRFDADGRAVGALLELYQGVRFGARRASPADVDTARDSLQRLAASWRDDSIASGR